LRYLSALLPLILLPCSAQAQHRAAEARPRAVKTAVSEGHRAASLISAYRAAHGLKGVKVDAHLIRPAEHQARHGRPARMAVARRLRRPHGLVRNTRQGGRESQRRSRQRRSGDRAMAGVFRPQRQPPHARLLPRRPGAGKFGSDILGACPGALIARHLRLACPRLAGFSPASEAVRNKTVANPKQAIHHPCQAPWPTRIKKPSASPQRLPPSPVSTRSRSSSAGSRWSIA